jgi:cytochrome c553
MKRSFYSLLILSVLGWMSCTDKKQTSSTESIKPTDSLSEDPVKQGEHLVAIMGCNDCHSPKKMGANGPEIIPELMLSGYPSDRPVARFDSNLVKTGFAVFYPDLTAAAGPWGVSFAGNLTPDETGIGTWTEEQFRKALTEGKLKGQDGGRPLLPPMPWMNYKSLSEKEVSNIFTYLKSIKPVKNMVPKPVAPGAW